MPFIMLYLIAGTVSQKFIGLYRSTDLFFSGWIEWIGYIPIPGFFTIMAIFTINLFFRFLFKSPWTWNKAGLHLTHFGALLLIVGGLVTAMTTKEGFLVIPEGGTQSIASDYNKRSLVLFEGNTLLAAVPFHKLHKGQNFSFAGLDITIADKCNNCGIQENKQEDDSVIKQSMAKFMQLTDKDEEIEPEMNMNGLTLDIQTTQQDKPHRYLAFEGMPKPITIEAIQNDQSTKTIDILLGKEQWPLPFSITLKDFEKMNYPGTDQAKGYRSQVVLETDDLSWPFEISMNNPLRYNGYSVYQSSFDIKGDGTEISVFAVVYNQGHIIAYISTLILCAGLLLHVYIYYKNRRKKNA